MKKMFLLGLLWWNCYSYSQHVYFNNRYDFNNELEVVWTILPVDTGYLCAVGTGKILIQYINLQGELIWQKAFGDSDKYYYAGFSNSFVPTIDGGYVLGGSVHDTSGDADGLLIKFNSELDTIWIKQFGASYSEVFYQCKQTIDDAYILVGAKSITQGNPKTWIVKTDSLGNLKWEKTYNGYGGTSVVVTKEGNYLFRDGNNLTKTDTVGNVIWSKTVGGILNLVEASNGDYIGCYGRLDSSFNNTYYYTPSLIRTDTAGNIIWQKGYGTSSEEAGFTSVFENTDGDVIATGQITNELVGAPEGVILKTNATGDILWYRVVKYNDCDTNSNYLRDIKQTDDGGFIAAGFFGPFPFYCMEDTGNQDMWIMKLDSCGCLTPLCDSVCAGLVGLEEEVFNLEEEIIKAYPNPANNSLTFDYRISQDYNNATIGIYNIMGEQVFNYKIINSVGKVQINTGILSSGVYFYALTVNNNTIAREKLIIIKQNPE